MSKYKFSNEFKTKLMAGNCLAFSEDLSDELDKLGIPNRLFSIIIGGGDACIAHIILEANRLNWDASGSWSDSELRKAWSSGNIPFLEGESAEITFAPYEERHWEHYSDAEEHGDYEEYETDENEDEDFEEEYLDKQRHYGIPGRWDESIAEEQKEYAKFMAKKVKEGKPWKDPTRTINS